MSDIDPLATDRLLIEGGNPGLAKRLREVNCTCGHGPEPAETHLYDCPYADSTIQPSPCDSHYEDGLYLVVTRAEANDESTTEVAQRDQDGARQVVLGDASGPAGPDRLDAVLPQAVGAEPDLVGDVHSEGHANSAPPVHGDETTSRSDGGLADVCEAALRLAERWNDWAVEHADSPNRNVSRVAEIYGTHADDLLQALRPFVLSIVEAARE